jgi:hypothetical protein
MTNDRTILRYFPDGTARTPSINPAPEKLHGPKEDARPWDPLGDLEVFAQCCVIGVGLG